MSTQGGIQAGVMWTIVAGIRSFIEDRWRLESEATVVFTGGDGKASAWVLQPAHTKHPPNESESLGYYILDEIQNIHSV